MAKLPKPPPAATLAALGPALRVVPAGARVWRIYFQGGPHPTTWDRMRWFGPTQSRFDHHLPPPSMQGRAILYGTHGPQAAVTALAEVFQGTRTVERAPNHPALVAFDVTRDLALLDLTGTWPTRAGASMAISTGRKDRARDWSQAAYAAYPTIDGLLYGSSMHANAPCLALYERAANAIPTSPAFHRLLADPVMLGRLRRACLALNYQLV